MVPKPDSIVGFGVAVSGRETECGRTRFLNRIGGAMISVEARPMKLKKSPQELIDLFVTVMPGPPATGRKMFGYPAGFVNGNMFMGLFQDEMILRLPDGDREELIQKHGAKPFEPMPGRPMKEYVSLPHSLMKERKEIDAWVAKALVYGASLKPKSKAKRSAKAKTKRRPA